LWQAPLFFGFLFWGIVMSIMTRIAEAVSEIEKARVKRSNGDVFAMVAELDRSAQMA
jgi:hypothetical protein